MSSPAPAAPVEAHGLAAAAEAAIARMAARRGVDGTAMRAERPPEYVAGCMEALLVLTEPGALDEWLDRSVAANPQEADDLGAIYAYLREASARWLS